MQDEIILATTDIISFRDVAQLSRDGYDVVMEGDIVAARRRLNCTP